MTDQPTTEPETARAVTLARVRTAVSVAIECRDAARGAQQAHGGA